VDEEAQTFATYRETRLVTRRRSWNWAISVNCFVLISARFTVRKSRKALSVSLGRNTICNCWLERIQTVEFGRVPNPKNVVERCASLLVDGGTLAIAVPNDLNSYRGKRLLRTSAARRFRAAWRFGRLAKIGLPNIILDGSLTEIYLSHFTPGVLRRSLEQSGFSVIVSTLDPYYEAVGFAEQWEAGFRLWCRILNRIFLTNVYDTMLLVARKTSSPKPQTNGRTKEEISWAAG
jgi:hypothetical protein